MSMVAAANAHRVAVIGAGAAGLVAARELQRQGQSVVVYEQQDRLGGVWSYTPEVDGDPLGLKADRKRVHCSMYDSLRTNLPREIMGYLDFPFLPKEGRDGRRYPGHEEVLLYLQDFAEHFHLLPCIRFGRRVTYVGIQKLVVKDGASALFDGSEPHAILERMNRELTGSDTPNLEGPFRDSESLFDIQWSVSSVASKDPCGINSVEEEVFDAIVVCNGHYFQPQIAAIPGIEKWPGKQLHSHNYRVPYPFSNQVVVVIGNASSGSDLARELATVAKEVHWAGRTWQTSIDMLKRIGPSSNIYLHLMVQSAHEDGTVKFEDGNSIVADAIVHCTGYAFSFPFLDTCGTVNVHRDHVGPLYQHVFPPLLAPLLSFVGLPFKVVPFPLMELQAKWISLILSGKVQLPSRKDMMHTIEELYATIEAKGWKRNKTHDLGPCQFAYNEWLANKCGCNPCEHWREEIYLVSSRSKRTNPDSYRDTWTDQYLQEISMADLLEIERNIQCI